MYCRSYKSSPLCSLISSFVPWLVLNYAVINLLWPLDEDGPSRKQMQRHIHWWRWFIGRYAARKKVFHPTWDSVFLNSEWKEYYCGSPTAPFSCLLFYMEQAGELVQDSKWECIENEKHTGNAVYWVAAVAFVLHGCHGVFWSAWKFCTLEYWELL